MLGNSPSRRMTKYFFAPGCVRHDYKLDSPFQGLLVRCQGMSTSGFLLLPSCISDLLIWSAYCIATGHAPGLVESDRPLLIFSSSHQSDMATYCGTPGQSSDRSGPRCVDMRMRPHANTFGSCPEVGQRSSGGTGSRKT